MAAATNTTFQREVNILVSNIATAHQGSDSARFLNDVLVPITRKNITDTMSPGAKITFRFASEGIFHPAFEAFRYLPELNPTAMFEAVTWAEEAGFDAAILGCFGDPFIDEARQATNIPILGFGESALRAAAEYGRFGVIANSGLLIEGIRGQIERLGLTDQLVDIIETSEPVSEQENSLFDAQSAIKHFRTDAAPLVEAGAQAIIPACGIMSAALHMAPSRNDKPLKPLDAINGVVIIDIVAEAARAAEQAIRSETCPNPVSDSALPTIEHSTPSGPFWNCY